MRLAVCVFMMVVVAGCSSDSPGTSPTTGGADPVTTSTSAPEVETTSSTTAATSEVDTDPLADGSGCTPGDGELPDGRWFGYVERAEETSVEFDLACWFSGEAADAAALEDGDSDVPVPNNYYVRNLSSDLRSVPIADGAQVTWLEDPDPSRPTISDYPVWRQARAGRDYLPGVWLEVLGGQVTGIEEQYVP